MSGYHFILKNDGWIKLYAFDILNLFLITVISLNFNINYEVYFSHILSSIIEYKTLFVNKLLKPKYGNSSCAIEEHLLDG